MKDSFNSRLCFFQLTKVLVILATLFTCVVANFAQPPRRISLADRQNPTLSDINADVRVDQRVIVMMAALNIAGYDYESGGRELSTLRQQIREDIKTTSPQIVRKLRDHFQAHRAGKTDVVAAAAYLSLALSLTQPPVFTVEVPVDQLPTDVRGIVDFALLLEEFYQVAAFSRLMPKYVAAYNEAARNIGHSLALAASAVISYLHAEPILELPPLYIPRPRVGKKETKAESIKVSNRVRRFVVMPDTLNAIGTANLRVVRDTYYLLLGPTSEPNIDAMRRAFLTFVIDPLTEHHVKEVASIRNELKKLVEARGDKIDPEYKERSAYYLITDSLVRAANARMAVVGLPMQRGYKEADAIYDLSLAYERGAVLVFHFYDRMAAYDQVGINLKDYLSDLLTRIDFAREMQRLDEYAQRLTRYKQARLESAALPAPPPIANTDERTVARLLEADQLIKARHYDDAKTILQAILRDHSKNARALFGLAEVTSKKASQITDSDRLAEELYAAVELYKQAAENASPDAEKWLAQRSYVAAGNILDFLGEMQDAAVAFDLAIKLGESADKSAYEEAVKAKQQREQKGKP